MTASEDHDVSSELAFVIHPATEFLSVDVLLNALNDIRRLLRGVDYAIHGRSHRPRWDVRSLRSSSPTIAVRPSAVNGSLPNAVREISAGLQMVTAGIDYPPPHFTEKTLLDLKEMRRLFRGSEMAQSIAVFEDGEQVASIGSDIAVQADRILGAGYHNLGAIEGWLEVINVHRTRKVTIWDRVYRAPVRCVIPGGEEWLSCAKDLLGKRVLIAGNIHYFANGVPRSVDQVTAIEDASPDPRWPKAEYGSIPDARASENPAAYLQSVREGGGR